MDKEGKIVQKSAKVLREKAKEVAPADISSPKIKKILADMSTALAGEYDGVALAAPQIGVPLRIFVVSGKVLPKKAGQLQPDMVFINPVLKKVSAKKVAVEEGCLSVRWLYGKVKRAETATVEAYNEKGNKFVKNGKGLMAQIFQHEMDHLEGKLFIDKAFDIFEAKPEDQE